MKLYHRAHVKAGMTSPHFSFAFGRLLLALLLALCPGVQSTFAQNDDEPTSPTSITVQVTGPDGTPCRNAQAAWFNHGEYGSFERQAPFEAVPLDSTGQGSLTTQYGNRIVVKAWAPGMAPTYRYIDVMGTSTQHPVSLALAPGATIHGKLHSTEAVRVTTGSVRVVYSRHDPETPFGKRGNYIDTFRDILTTVPLSATGTFTVTGVPAGNLWLHLVTENYLPVLSGRNSVPMGICDGETTTVVIPVLPVGRVTGTIRDNKGRPIPRVWLSAYDTESDHYYVSEGATDAQGRFAISNVRPLPFLINFRPFGRDFFEGPFAAERYNDKDMEITLDLDSVTSAADYAAYLASTQPKPETYKLTGTVTTFPEGESPSLFRVQKSESSGNTAVAQDLPTSGPGRFIIESNSQYDDVAVTVSAPGYFPVRKTMEHDRANNFLLRKTTTMTISVVDAATSRPLPGVEIKGYVYSGLNKHTDHNGTCHFDNFPSGTIRMVVTPPPGHRPLFTYVDPEKATSVTIPVIPGGKIQGRLVQQPGSIPLANIRVSYRPLGDNRAQEDEGIPNREVTETTDANGNFTLYDYGSGPAVATFHHFDLKVTFPPVLPGETLTRQVELGSASVRLQSNLRRMAYIRASARAGDLEYSLTSDYHRNSYRLATDLAGNLSLQNMPAGDWLFSFMSGTYSDAVLREVGPVTVPETGSTVVHASEQLE